MTKRNVLPPLNVFVTLNLAFEILYHRKHAHLQGSQASAATLQLSQPHKRTIYYVYHISFLISLSRQQCSKEASKGGATRDLFGDIKENPASSGVCEGEDGEVVEFTVCICLQCGHQVILQILDNDKSNTIE